jgi:signal transduction histidine kinase
MQGRFLSDASHELRIPTAVIKTSCDVTLGRERTAKEYEDTLRTIAGMANRITDIINRILEVSRLESSTFLLKLSDVDLMDIVHDVVRLIEPFALSRGITIKLNGSSANINADRERLIEVFTNILDNAVKYNKPNGRVDIEVSKWDGEAIVEVADTGMGIPDNEKERIFDRFYRLDGSRNMTAGSGLGLSIVQAIVKAHGGRVEVESKVNKGSCFIVYLPMGS